MKNPIKLLLLGLAVVVAGAAIYALNPKVLEPPTPPPETEGVTPSEAPDSETPEDDSPSTNSAPGTAPSAVVFIDEQGNRITPSEKQMEELRAATKSLPAPATRSASTPVDPNDLSKGYMIKAPRLTYSVARIGSDGATTSHCLPEEAARAFVAEPSPLQPAASTTQEGAE